MTNVKPNTNTTANTNLDDTDQQLKITANDLYSDKNVAEKVEESNIELNDENENDEEEETYTPSMALEELSTYCAQEEKFTRLLPTEHIGILKDVVNLIEDLLDIPHQEYFIKAVFNKSGFTGFRYPDLALFKGKISMIWHGNIIDVEQFFISAMKLKGNKPFIFSVTDNRLNLQFNHPDDSSTKLFNISVFTRPFNVNDPKTKLDDFKLESNIKYLKDTLCEYTFPTSYLTDGEYNVSKLFKKNDISVVTLDDGRDFYITDYLASNLKIAEDSGDRMALIVDGERESANGQVWKNIYVKGFPPSIKPSALVKKLADQLGYECIENQPFPEPIKIPVVGYQDTKGNGKMPDSFVLSVLDGDKVVNLRPNSAMTTAMKTGMFKLRNWEGVKMVVYATGIWIQKTKDSNGNPIEIPHMTVQLNWEIPDSAKAVNTSLNKLKEALKAKLR